MRHLGLEDGVIRPGGLNRYLLDLLAAERSIGIEAEAVVLGGTDGEPRAEGIRWAAPMSASLPRRVLAMARAAGRRPLPDVVDSHFALYSLLPLSGRLRRRPLIVHFQGPWADESTTEGSGGINARAKRWIEGRVYRRADRVLVLSRAFERLVVDRYGVDPSRVLRFAPGVDLERFTPGDRAEARGRLGVDASARLIVSVRRLRKRMGLEAAIEAIAGLEGSVQLAIVGDGPERRRLEDLAEELGAAVRFVGRTTDDELVDWYRAADASVVPTVALEGFGLVVLESLACGTPVIASDLDGLRDALDGLEGSCLIPPGDVRALASAIERVGDLPSSAACRQHAQRHSWAAVAELHREVYLEVAGRRRRPLVVVLGHSAALSGGELAMARLAPAMSDGADVHVILAEDGPLVRRLESCGVSVEVLAMDEGARSMGRERVGPGLSAARSALATAAYVRRLRRRLSQLDPDVVHTNTLKAALYGGLAARLAMVPTVVWHLRDRIDVDYLPASAVRLVRFAARRLPDAVVANSSATLATLGNLSQPSLVLASPLDPAIAATDPPEELQIGMIGRIAPWKGQRLFVDAYARAFPDGGPPARIVGAPLFGEEDSEAALAREVEAHGLTGQIELVGFREDVAAELEAISVLVHASTIPEPFGQVVVEGMGAGRCVIAAGAGGPAEVITHGVDGLLYEMGSADDLAAALRRACEDPELRARLGRAGSESAEAYRAPRLAAQLLAFYEGVGRLR